MPNEVLGALALLTAATLWLALRWAVASHRAEQHRRIAQRGVTCLGKVVAVQRPFMLDDCTRLYFDFVPRGTDEPIRACHIAWRRPDESASLALPPQGATVIVRYLPEFPTKAVIGGLVAD